MSIVIKTRKAKPRTWSTTIMWLVFGVAAIFFLIIYGQQLLLENSLKERIAVQRAANTTLQDANSRLKAGLIYFESDKYIEQRAREDLNLRRPDEEVIIPIKQQAATTGPSPTTKSATLAAPSPAEQRGASTANWLGWVALFSPPGNASQP